MIEIDSIRCQGGGRRSLALTETLGDRDEDWSTGKARRARSGEMKRGARADLTVEQNLDSLRLYLARSAACRC